MGYIPEERETVIIYDELTNSWQFQSNIRRHITKILKSEDAFDNVQKEMDGKICISVIANLSDLKNFSVNPFVKKKPKLSEKQRQDRADRLRRNFS